MDRGGRGAEALRFAVLVGRGSGDGCGSCELAMMEVKHGCSIMCRLLLRLLVEW